MWQSVDTRNRCLCNFETSPLSPMILSLNWCILRFFFQDYNIDIAKTLCLILWYYAYQFSLPHFLMRFWSLEETAVDSFEDEKFINLVITPVNWLLSLLAFFFMVGNSTCTCTLSLTWPCDAWWWEFPEGSEAYVACKWGGADCISTVCNALNTFLLLGGIE